MVNNILIFRTDKIGDLLITCPVVLTIKKHLTNSKITLITSKNNHNYAKSFELIDDIVMFPQGNLLEKFKPHITIARIKKPSKLKEFKEYINYKIQGNSEVSYIELIESEMTKKGPNYTVLQIFDL